MVKFLFILAVVASTAILDAALDSKSYANFPNSADLQPLNAFSSSGYPANCLEATAATNKSGLYVIQLPSVKPVIVYCEHDEEGGGWLVVQRRRDGNINFYRGWHDYKNGFGRMEGDFWLGLDWLHAFTTSTNQELRVVMESFESVQKYAIYRSFLVGSESEGYTLKSLGAFIGTSGDSMRPSEGRKFSTKDVKNNDRFATNCAVDQAGAWWYWNCSYCNPNGRYLHGVYSCTEPKCEGIYWYFFRGYKYSLKFIQMMIRPRKLQ